MPMPWHPPPWRRALPRHESPCEEGIIMPVLLTDTLPRVHSPNLKSICYDEYHRICSLTPNARFRLASLPEEPHRPARPNEGPNEAQSLLAIPFSASCSTAASKDFARLWSDDSDSFPMVCPGYIFSGQERPMAIMDEYGYYAWAGLDALFSSARSLGFSMHSFTASNTPEQKPA